MVSVEQIHYQNWLEGLRLSNGQVDLVVTTQVGPRIIRFGLVGADNEFAELPSVSAASFDGTWNMLGGHRLWHAPEIAPRTYHPDNDPVTWHQQGDTVRFTQATEKHTGIQKEIDIWLAPDAPHAKLTHRLINRGVWPVELAPWAISVMAPGGVGIIPLPPRGPHPENLLPKSTLTLWAYTDLADPRWVWGTKHILLRQDANRPAPQKIGASVPDGWVAYARRGHLFVKTFTPIAGATYPDMNCMVELFTIHVMQEVETFGPVVRLEPGEAVEHVEQWHLLRDVSQPDSERDVEMYVAPRVKKLFSR
jgi:hypothetical protein